MDNSCSNSKLFPQQAMDNPIPTFIHQLQMNLLGDSLDEFNFQSSVLESMTYFSSSLCVTGQASSETPEKLLNTAEHTIPSAYAPFSFPHLIFLDNENSPPSVSQQSYGNLCCTMMPKDNLIHTENKNFSSLMSLGYYENQNCSPGSCQESMVINEMTRSHLQAEEHIISERKRREKLSQLFIVLSAIIPGLKKMNRTSILEGTIKYIKELEEREKKLEEQAKNKTVKSIVPKKKSQLPSDDDHNCSSHDRSEQSGLEIEAKVLDKEVLIRIHCEKQKGFIVRIVTEIEKLHLTVLNSSVMPFGKYAMDVTVVAQMGGGVCMTATDLVRNLQVALDYM